MRLVVFGVGSVGRALCKQATKVGARIVGLADSSGVLLSDKVSGFGTNELEEILEAKATGTSLKVNASSSQSIGHTHHKHNSISKPLAVITPAEFISKLDAINTSSKEPLVLTDCSAYHDPETYLLPAQKLGVPVVLANKKPLTGTLSHFLQLTQDRRLIRFESTVGAGLPTMIALRRLLDAGDDVATIQGSLSGSIGYIFDKFSHSSSSFSSAVLEAKDKGYTEPDPRDDLSGFDIARKALIIARCLGSTLCMEDLNIQALYPQDMASLSLSQFMQQLSRLDTFVEEQKTALCKTPNSTLRYLCQVKREKGKIKVDVGLTAVDESDPAFGTLKGTDNCVVYKTDHYDTNPLVIRGPGAGREVTADGVLSDCMDLYGSQIRRNWGV